MKSNVTFLHLLLSIYCFSPKANHAGQPLSDTDDDYMVRMRAFMITIAAVFFYVVMFTKLSTRKVCKHSFIVFFDLSSALISSINNPFHLLQPKGVKS